LNALKKKLMSDLNSSHLLPVGYLQLRSILVKNKKQIKNLTVHSKDFLKYYIIFYADTTCRTRHRGDLKKLKIAEKEQISGILFFDGEMSCLRSRHLVLWSLGTLTGQQRFYGTGLVT